MITKEQLQSLSDDKIMENIGLILGNERKCKAWFLAYLGEIDHRQLYLREDCGSLYTLLRKVYGMSKSSASIRGNVARIAYRFPVIYNMIETGVIHMSTVSKLKKHLTEENHAGLLKESYGLSNDEVDYFIARKFPEQVPQRDYIRLVLAEPEIETVSSQKKIEPEIETVSSPKKIGSATVSPKKSTHKIKPVSDEYIRYGFTGDKEFHSDIEWLRSRLKGKCPTGDIGKLLKVVLSEYREKHDVQRKDLRAKSRKSRRIEPSNKRTIPESVKRKVRQRDQYQCTHIDKNGIRCSETKELEYHHVVEFSYGGSSSDPDNITLLCRDHHQMKTIQTFGKPKIPASG